MARQAREWTEYIDNSGNRGYTTDTESTRYLLYRCYGCHTWSLVYLAANKLDIERDDLGTTEYEKAVHQAEAIIR